MKLFEFDGTLFVGMSDKLFARFPFEQILVHFANIRDAIAGTQYILPTDLSRTIANASFVYAFNTYKAIGLLLPELYHESGAVLLRQLWEVSLNLHWISEDFENRVRDFCNFTLIEYRNLLKKFGNKEDLRTFDHLSENFQQRFRYRDAKGRNRVHSNFAKKTIYDRAVELGDPWNEEYPLIYNLTSMNAHGAPGAIMYSIFLQNYSFPDIREKNASALIAIYSINTMVRNVLLLKRLSIILDASQVEEIYGLFQSCLGKITANI